MNIIESFYIKARAKVNLSLNITSKKENGYHNIQSVFQSISLYDEIYIEKTNLSNIQFICNNKDLENNNNIIYKTYSAMKEKYPIISGVKVTLIKNIPTQAGLGGGSSDCANFLIGLNKLYNLNCTTQELVSIGKNLGADVPFCISKKTSLVKGIGEIITPINSNLKYYILIIKPPISFNTKLMYEKFDITDGIKQIYSSNNIITALSTNNINLLCNNLYNVFENTVENNIINNIKEVLIKNGAVGSLMTGSGSCVFGIFKDKVKCKQAYNKLKNFYKIFYCINCNYKK